MTKCMVNCLKISKSRSLGGYIGIGLSVFLSVHPSVHLFVCPDQLPNLLFDFHQTLCLEKLNGTGYTTNVHIFVLGSRNMLSFTNISLSMWETYDKVHGELSQRSMPVWTWKFDAIRNTQY
jgi:hypothetical protein